MLGALNRTAGDVTISTLVYGTAGRGGRALTVHVLRPQPAPSGPAPAIVGVHGGAFRSGSKDAYVLRLLPFARRGYVCASVEYRLSGEARWPAQIEDCKCAVRFLRANAPALGIDPQRIGAWGSSAGGHLAALLGTSSGVAALDGTGGWEGHSSEVQAVCDWFGPVDFARLVDQPSTIDRSDPACPESELLGGNIADLPEIARTASPVTYVDGDEPPFLILHGTEDPLIPHQQSHLFYESLTRGDVTFVSLPGAKHGGWEFEHPATLRLVHAFFDAHLRPAARGTAPHELGLHELGVALPSRDPGPAPEMRRVSSRSWHNPGYVPPLTEYKSFHSTTVGGPVGYALYLPPGYGDREHAAARYPVVYWLHGMAGGPWRGARFVELLDRAIREGVAPPAIAVLATGGPRSMYVDAKDGSWPVETVLVREIIPHVDATYRTVATREGRVVEGQSMGGWGAARLGFAYPELFGGVSIAAGALIPLDRERAGPRFHSIWGGDAAYFEETNPRTIVRRNAARIREAGQRVRLFVGDQDRLLEANRTFSTLLDELGIAHEYVEVPGAGHGYDDKVGRLGLGCFAWFARAFAAVPRA